jgi:hypothetical protein
MYIDALDIITPIHINTTMKVGSMSLRDSRAFSPIVDKPNVVDLTKVKALLTYDGVNSKILSSFGISAVLKNSTGNYDVYFEKPFKTENYMITGNGLNLTTGDQSGLQFDVIFIRKNMARINLNYNSGGGTGNDVADSSMCMTVFGEQEDETEV